MAGETHDLDPVGFARLLAGEAGPREFLAQGDRLRAQSLFHYPGRRGAVIVHMVPGTGPSADKIRISDGGDLIKSLEEQGMDLSVDMILSKTVFHAVKSFEGAGIAHGQVYLDCTNADLLTALWRFLQMVAELVGMRHAKYKDALLRLSRQQDAPDLIGWNDR